MNSKKQTTENEHSGKGKEHAPVEGKNVRESVRENVLAKIDAKEVRMRSRAFFVIRIIGIIILALVALAVSIGIVNFLSFMLRVNGQAPLLGLGWQGVCIFIQVFPWPLLILDLICIFFLERLLRVFRFGYRSPALALFLGILLIALVGGVLIDRGTPLNDDLLHQADQGHLPPPLGAFYQDSRRPPPPGSGAYRGTIESVMPPILMLNDPDLSTTSIEVMLPGQGAAQGHEPQANGDSDHDQLFSAGDSVMVVGSEQNGIIYAQDIYPLDPDDLPPFNQFDHDDGTGMH